MTTVEQLRHGKPYYTDEARWLAVSRRDRAADGKFVYSVKTTGIYCRPSCPSRQALRKNVRFHESCQQAKAAGFRACKRCQPHGASLSERQAAAIARACRAIEAASQMPTLEDLAKQAGMSRFHFHRLFKAQTGVTPRAYAAAHRGRRLEQLLPRAKTITHAIYGAGFRSSASFYGAADALLGMQPQSYRAGGAGMTIRFAIGQCWLGAILVAATQKGVCAILLGEDPEALAQDLQNRFPRAELVGGDRKFERLVAQVIGFVEDPSCGFDLPLDIRGTAFQRQVWEALRGVPCGSTVSYAEIARRVGRPGAFRAVGSAIAANPIAVAIPCHRVIRTDGALSGYRWGVERKDKLQHRERAASSERQAPRARVTKPAAPRSRRTSTVSERSGSGASRHG